MRKDNKIKNDSKQWSGQSRGGYYGYLFFIFLIKLFGVRIAYFFLFFIIPYFIVFAPKATRAIWNYNRNILKYGFLESIFKIFSHYYVFGQTIIDKISINSGLESQYTFEYENKSEFLHKLDSGSAIIMIGAHIGCWEIGSTFFGDYGKKINIVISDGESQRVKEALSKQGNKCEFNIIDANQDGIGLILEIKKALDNKEYLCFQGDRYMRSRSVLEHTFMGKTAYFPKGIFEIASKFKVPIVFYFALRTKAKTYKFLFEVIEQTEKNTKEYILDKYVEKLEIVLKDYPQQWFNFYDYWVQPKGEHK